MNDHSKPSESSLSSLGGLSGARRAAIRARLEKIAPGPWRSDPGYDGGATVAIMRDWRPGREIAAAVQGPDAWIHRVDLNTPDANADFIAHAPDDVRDLLAAVDQITREREQYRVQVEERYGAVAQWQAEAEINRQAWLKAEAALVVLTQRQEQVKALAEKWRRRSEVLSGQIRGKADIVRQCADDLEKALGLLGSAAPEDSTR